MMHTFRQHLLTYLDNKFWTSIKALHWMTTFLEPTFKSFEFIPQVTMEDIRFKRNLMMDLDGWIMTEMTAVAEKMKEENDSKVARLEKN